MDQRSYPEGRTPFYSKWVGDILKFVKRSSGVEFFSLNGSTGDVYGTGIVKSTRQRFTIAQVNAGATILPAVEGYKYRLIDAKIIAIGGAAAAGTTVDIGGTQTSAVKLVAFAQAGLTQNTLLRDGDASGAILAAGASYVQNDVNTAITIGKTGSAFTTATHFDVVLSYALEV